MLGPKEFHPTPFWICDKCDYLEARFVKEAHAWYFTCGHKDGNQVYFGLGKASKLLVRTPDRCPVLNERRYK